MRGEQEERPSHGQGRLAAPHAAPPRRAVPPVRHTRRTHRGADSEATAWPAATSSCPVPHPVLLRRSPRSRARASEGASRRRDVAKATSALASALPPPRPRAHSYPGKRAGRPRFAKDKSDAQRGRVIHSSHLATKGGARIGTPGADPRACAHGGDGGDGRACGVWRGPRTDLRGPRGAPEESG